METLQESQPFISDDLRGAMEALEKDNSEVSWNGNWYAIPLEETTSVLWQREGQRADGQYGVLQAITDSGYVVKINGWIDYPEIPVAHA